MFEVSRNGRDPVDSDQMLAVLDTIEAEVPKIPIRYGDDETSSVSDFMGTQFAQLTALVTKMASQFDDRQSDLDKYRATLDDEHKTRMEELEETFKLRTAELTEKEKEIEDKRRELDDRDNVHVRRELRERITNQLKQRLKEPLVTKTPATVRNTVVILCVGASAFLFWFAFQSQQQIGSTTDVIEKWAIVLKTLFAGAGAAGFLVYAISWLRRVYMDDVQLERSLERYALDIDRASWSIETLIEMSKTEGAQVPAAWVDGACRDLFSQSSHRDDPTALQALGALMDVAAGAEVGPEGARITLNRKGTRQVGRQAQG
jgi:DNA-binding transcriptional MerR regulator